LYQGDVYDAAVYRSISKRSFHRRQRCARPKWSSWLAANGTRHSI